MTGKRGPPPLLQGQKTLGSFFKVPGPAVVKARDKKVESEQGIESDAGGSTRPSSRASAQNTAEIGGVAGPAAGGISQMRAETVGRALGFQRASSLLQIGERCSSANPQTSGDVSEGPSEELKELWRKKKEERLQKLTKQKLDRQKSVQSSIEFCLRRSTAAHGSSSPLIDNAFNQLPVECWHIIFSYLPRQQLRTLRLCCSSWRSFVDAPDFMAHVKRYDALLGSAGRGARAATVAMAGVGQDPAGPPPELSDLLPEERWFAREGLVSIDRLLELLQRRTLFQTEPVHFMDMLQYLAQESGRREVDAQSWGPVLETMDVLKGQLHCRGWCLVLLALLFVLEREMLPDVLDPLLSGRAGASRMDAIEFLHLILAAPLSSTWRDETMPVLRHIDSAMNYLELAAEEQSGAEGKRSHVALTPEQHDIIDTDLRPDQVMVITAFAGTGKTTTLVEYTRRRPGRSFAYLVFNRSVMLEAEHKFPRNTKCLNFHRLAYSKMGWLYKHKLSASQPKHIVARALGLTNPMEAFFAAKTLEWFLQSADEDISESHVPPAAHKVPLGIAPGQCAQHFVNLATQLWLKMKDKQSTEVFMTHSGYLKLYQLTQPRLDFTYDVLMLDEAQDASPVMADIVLRQTGCSKIVVGDPHQQIYGFMGAINVMKKVCDSEARVVERRLTRSFRFGAEIARVCNCILQFKGERLAVIGARSSTPRSQEDGSQALLPVQPLGDRTFDEVLRMARALDQSSTPTTASASPPRPVALIARSNATLFEGAASTSARKLAFVGGLKECRFDLLLDTWHLLKDEVDLVKDAYLRSLGSARVLEEMARLTEDVELATRINIVRRNFDNLDDKIKAIESRDVGADLSKAQVVFTTAHKAKGLEFDIVVLADDFVKVSTLSRSGDTILAPVEFLGSVEYEEVPTDEVNLVYVAASRAKMHLFASADVAQLTRSYAEGWREPELVLRSTKAHLRACECAQCRKPCSGALVAMFGPKIVKGEITGTEQEGQGGTREAERGQGSTSSPTSEKLESRKTVCMPCIVDRSWPEETTLCTGRDALAYVIQGPKASKG